MFPAPKNMEKSANPDRQLIDALLVSNDYILNEVPFLFCHRKILSRKDTVTYPKGRKQRKSVEKHAFK